MGKTVGEGFDHIGTTVEAIASSALDTGSRSSVAAAARLIPPRAVDARSTVASVECRR